MKSSPHFYNEFDPYCAQWLRNLISAGEIPDGVVDERSIVDVQPEDLAGFAQCHFFAGIGGWALAARLAGWPVDRELWSGSAPCQPFSVAGKQSGFSDARDLWPHYFRLARARRPAVLVGEQVAAAIGQNWLDRVHADLESINYSGGGIIIPACSVNAPHRRDRLWFLFARGSALDHSNDPRLERLSWDGDDPAGWTIEDRPATEAGSNNTVAEPRRPGRHGKNENAAFSGSNRPNDGLPIGSSSELRRALADPDRNGCPSRRSAASPAGYGDALDSMRGSNAWDGAGWIIGHDGKARRVEPSIHLLAHGVSARVGKLRAYGNAIVPQVAAEVLAAWMECQP